MRFILFLTFLIASAISNAQDFKVLGIEEAYKLNQDEPKYTLVYLHNKDAVKCIRELSALVGKSGELERIGSDFYLVSLKKSYGNTIVLGTDTFKIANVNGNGENQLATLFDSTGSGKPALVVLDKDFRIIYTYLGKIKPEAITKAVSSVTNKENLIAKSFLSPKAKISKEATSGANKASREAPATVKWYTFEEAYKLNKISPKKIMVDVYTNWCGWCKVLDKKTFSHPEIARYLNTQYYPVKLNAEQREDIVLDNDTLKFIASGSKGYHELAAGLLKNKLSYPSVVFMDERNQIIHVQQGFTKPQPFDMLLKFIGGNHYATQKWDAWSASYVSPIASE